MPALQVTLLGTGTSQGIPVIGCSCVTCRSSDPRDKRLRSSLRISSEQTHVVIDTGPDFRQQMLQWGPPKLDAVVFTHEHNDHIAGLDDIRPYYFRQRCPIPLYGLPRVLDNIQKRFDYLFFNTSYPGIPSVHLHELTPYATVRIGDIALLPLTVYHGQLPILGFKIGNLAYLTDVKSIPDETLAHLHGLDTLILNALQPSPHHSHLSLQEALQWIDELKPRRAFLTHLSHHLGPHRDLHSQLPPHIAPAYDGLTIDVER